MAKKTLLFYLDDDLKSEIEKKAKDFDISVSSFIRMAIKEFLNKK